MSARSYITIGVLLLLVVLFQQATTYAGRVDDRKDKIAACERSIKDRKGLVMLSTALRDGFKSTDDRVGAPLTPARIKAEAQVQEALSGFNARSKVDCQKAFPAPPVFQFG